MQFGRIRNQLETLYSFLLIRYWLTCNGIVSLIIQQSSSKRGSDNVIINYEKLTNKKEGTVKTI